MPWRAMPLAPVAIAFAAGVGLAPWARPDVAWTTWLAALASTGALLLRGRTSGATALLLVGVAAVGALHGIEAPLPPGHVARLDLPRTAHVDGRLVAEPVWWAPDRVRLLIEVERVDGLERSGRIQATVYGVAPPLVLGQRITAELRLHPALGFRNPGTFDYAEHLKREDIRVTATARADRLTPVDHPAPPWPERIKRASVAAISQALPRTSAALLAGLLLGERTALPPELDEGFRRAGVYHVLAVSGFNVVLLAAAVLALCRLARVGRRVSAVAAIVVVVGFAAVVGPEPSVLRAVVMAGLVPAGLLLQRGGLVPHNPALAPPAVPALPPGGLLLPGFLVSFAPAPRGRHRLLRGSPRAGARLVAASCRAASRRGTERRGGPHPARARRRRGGVASAPAPRRPPARHRPRRRPGRRDRRRGARRPRAARGRGHGRPDAARRRRARGGAVPVEPWTPAARRRDRHPPRRRPCRWHGIDPPPPPRRARAGGRNARARAALDRPRHDLAGAALVASGWRGGGVPRRPVASGGCPARRARDASAGVGC